LCRAVRGACEEENTEKGEQKMNKVEKYVKDHEGLCVKNDTIPQELFEKYGVKKGLRDLNGQGVLTGLTNISQVRSFDEVDGKKIPCDGELLYRGYDVRELVKGGIGQRYIFEEGAYLLLFGELPDKEELAGFKDIIFQCMTLPTNFTRDVIMKAPGADIMNSMTRSILTLASYDPRKDILTLDNVLRQCIQLIGIFPMLAVYGYHAHNHYDNNGSMYIHRPKARYSLAENFLQMLRPDMQFTELEARVLDIALLLHMEHGGGNNSTFTTRVVTSSGSDTYSAIAAAMSSLKGKKHGGANLMVMNMMDDIRKHISDYSDKEEIAAYLKKLLHKEAFDRKGLIYGMGHAVYSLSDPRERVFKKFVEQLAKDKGRDKDMELYNNIEEIAPKLIAEDRKIFKGVSPNVDFYSGFVYDMLDIPKELYTPLFAVARVAGWSAHRMEELITDSKIIRPAYMSLAKKRDYVDRESR
jgi:citrate synthase